MPINIFRDVFRFGCEKFSFGGPKASGGAWTPAKLSGYAAEWDFSGTLPAKRNLAVATHATTNLLVAPERNFAPVGSFAPWAISASSTATDDFATDPLGGSNASRLNLIANGYAQQSALASSGGKTVTLSCYLKANSGSPTIKLGITDSVAGLTYSSNKSITNAWVQYSYTITLNASGKVSAVYIQDTGSASDVLVYGVQLEESASPSTYAAAQWDLQNDTRSTGPTQNTGYVSYAGAFGSSKAFAEAVSSVSTTTNKFVFAALVRQPAADAIAGYVPLINFPGNDTKFLISGNYTNPQDTTNCYFGGVRCQSCTPLRSTTSGAGNWRILHCHCDGSYLYIGYEGTITHRVAWAGTTATFKAIVLNNINTIMPGPSDWAWGTIATDCSASFVSSQLPQLINYVKNTQATPKALTLCPGNAFGCVFGDSFSDLNATAGNWVQYAGNFSGIIGNLWDTQAASGSTYSGQFAGQLAALQAQTPNLASLAHSVAVMQFGHNDLNSGSDQSSALLTSYAAGYTALKAAGFKKVMVITPWSRYVGANQTVYDTARANFRAGLVNGTHYDYLNSTSSFMSANGSFTTNPTYYIADGSHPSVAVGSQEIANVCGPTIATAMAA